MTASTWQRISEWPGGSVQTVALSPNFAQDQLALAGTAAGLFRSTDGGQHWQLCANGLADPDVVAVSFALSNRPQELCAVAVTAGGRLFISRDGGEQWTENQAFAGLGSPTALAISPNFAHDQTLFVATVDGIFRTQDGGKEWENASFGLHDPAAFCLACAPDFAESEVLWAGTAEGGFYRSRNGGRSWRDSGIGLPDGAIQCLLVSPHFAADQTLFVGSEADWIYRSTDGGATWQQAGRAPEECSVNALAWTAQNHLLAGTDRGIFRSLDNGQRWLATAPAELVVLALASANNTALAGTYGQGVALANANGDQWQLTDRGLIAHAPPVVVWTDSQLLALDGEGSLACAAGQAPQWTPLRGESVPPELVAVATNKEPAAPLFALTAQGELYQAVNPLAATAWSAHAEVGDGWQALAISPNFAQDRTLALADANGVIHLWRGDQFVPSAEDAPWQGAMLLQLAFSPAFATDQTLCVVSAQPSANGNFQMELWQSTDAAQSWNSVATFHSELPAVALAWPLDPTAGSLFLAANHRVIKLHRAAGELAVDQAFLDEGVRITALATSPAFATDHTLYAATSNGIYHSTDGGQNWQPMGCDLTEHILVAVDPDLSAQVVRAVELGGVLWQLPM